MVYVLACTTYSYYAYYVMHYEWWCTTSSYRHNYNMYELSYVIRLVLLVVCAYQKNFVVWKIKDFDWIRKSRSGRSKMAKCNLHFAKMYIFSFGALVPPAAYRILKSSSKKVILHIHLAFKSFSNSCTPNARKTIRSNFTFHLSSGRTSHVAVRAPSTKPLPSLT